MYRVRVDKAALTSGFNSILIGQQVKPALEKGARQRLVHYGGRQVVKDAANDAPEDV